MSDLISKSALMESLIHCDGLGRKSLEAVLKTIDEQSIAYDVDKVVKELEMKKKNICGSYNWETPILERPSCKVAFNNGICEAIESVKGGGVNEV